MPTVVWAGDEVSAERASSVGAATGKTARCGAVQAQRLVDDGVQQSEGLEVRFEEATQQSLHICLQLHCVVRAQTFHGVPFT